MIRNAVIFENESNRCEGKDLSTVQGTAVFLRSATKSAATCSEKKKEKEKVTLNGLNAPVFLPSLSHHARGRTLGLVTQGTDFALMKACWPCKISSSIFQYFIMALQQKV